MIKLERGERPKELTDEVCEELKKLYAEDRDKDVWNSTKIKKPLKEAMLDMSHGKCSYCECRLEIESLWKGTGRYICSTFTGWNYICSNTWKL